MPTMVEQPALEFAGLLRQLRAGARLTQEELAEASGLSPRSVSDLERGINHTARKDTAELLAGALGLDGSVRASFVAAARGRGAAADVLAAMRGEEAAPFGRPVRLAPRPPMLAGREALLTVLDVRLAAGDATMPRPVSLCGLGGAGKTSMAVEYAYRHLAEVQVAWQFPAEDTTVLAAGFGELAAQLGVRGPADTRDPVASVHAVLARFPAPWLLIFDNAEDMASVAPFLPPAGTGRVLITSQNPNWPGQVLEVPALDPDIAAMFLAGRTGDPDQEAALELASMLGGLPLALEQAAAYMLATGATMARYLALFRHRRAEMLARGEPAGYSKTVASTWTLALDRLRESEPAAVGLLRLLAFWAPEAIPLNLLLQPREALGGRLDGDLVPALAPLLEDPLAASDAIGALRRYSLINLLADWLVSVHRLVQAVTADQMPDGQAVRWRHAAAAVVGAAIPDHPEQPESWADFAALLPHARAALAPDHDAMARIVSYLGYTGRAGAARDLQQRIADTRARDLGPEHPDALAVRAHYAFWVGEAGDAVAARDLFAALVPVRERVSGLDHPDTLTARLELAHWTGRAGDAATARDLFAALVPVRERVSGSDHPDTLQARGHLAYWTGLAGNPAEARDLFAALLPVIEGLADPEHPLTLTGRNHHARWTGEAGDAVAARDLFAALVPVRERVSGPGHPETLWARDNLAHWTGRAGNPVAARDQHAALLPVNEQALGPEHPGTLTVRAHLASWTGEAGDAAAARDLFAMLLPVRERVSGPGHPDTLTARHELARWTRRAADPVTR
jgi:transcriptional regulator with XRE-family HTH domain